MKKIALALLATTLILTACGSNNEEKSSQQEDKLPEISEQWENMVENNSEENDMSVSENTDAQMGEDSEASMSEDDMMQEEDNSDMPVSQDTETQMDENSETSMTENDMTQEEDNSDMPVEEEMQENVKVGNVYVEYSDEVMADTQNPKILFFHATWCPTCKAANTAFEEIENTIGLDVVKVDYDEYGDLKSQYGVVSQHTFVLVDGNGNMLKRWYGSKNYEEILEELQS